MIIKFKEHKLNIPDNLIDDYKYATTTDLSKRENSIEEIIFSTCGLSFRKRDDVEKFNNMDDKTLEHFLIRGIKEELEMFRGY